TPVDARPIIRRTLQRACRTMATDSLAAYKRINLIRMRTATIGITRQFRERAPVNLAQFLIVLLRATSIDNPLASIKPSSGHHILIKRGKPIDNLSTGTRLR